MLRIEVLFPELSNLYGELANMKYLKESLSDAEFIETSYTDEPLFLTENVDMVYLGTMTEDAQNLIIDKLMPHRDRIRERIEEGMNFLITGNALEIFGNEIIEEGKTVTEGLGLFDFVSERRARVRYNCLYVGDFDAEGVDTIRIVGYKSLFGFSRGSAFEKYPFARTCLGWGINKDVKEEGIHYKNFIATYTTGPLFILNPPFMKWYMSSLLGDSASEPAFYDDAMKAYECRLEEYMAPGKGWEY